MATSYSTEPYKLEHPTAAGSLLPQGNQGRQATHIRQPRLGSAAGVNFAYSTVNWNRYPDENLGTNGEEKRGNRDSQ